MAFRPKTDASSAGAGNVEGAAHAGLLKTDRLSRLVMTGGVVDVWPSVYLPYDVSARREVQLPRCVCY